MDCPEAVLAEEADKDTLVEDLSSVRSRRAGDEAGRYRA